ncbi:hypothetical protein ACFE04_031973 [Oxalis oulophora]
MDESAASFRKDEVNDEECLAWAAIEKLPTMDQVRKGLFKPAVSPTDHLSEIDVIELSVQDKKDLIRRLVKDTHFDNERFLSSLRRRLDIVEAEAYVGSRALPSFTNFSIDVVEGLLQTLRLRSSQKKQLNILQGVNGIIKPSR